MPPLTTSSIDPPFKRPESTAQITAIVEAAQACFSRSGYAGASMREIAEKAGVSKSLLHYHFDSKEHLFVEVQIRFYERLGARITEAVAPIKQGQERGLLAFDALFEVLVQSNDLATQAELWAGALSNEKLRSHAIRLREFFRQMLVVRIEEILGPEIEHFPISPEASADLVWATLNGLGIKAAFGEPQERIQRAISALRTLITFAFTNTVTKPQRQRSERPTPPNSPQRGRRLPMHFAKLHVNQRAVQINKKAERIANSAIRSYDRIMGKLGIGGRRAAYDDEAYEFIGGAKDSLRKKHYDKSLRLLWKAEHAAPWTTFKDAGEAEKALIDSAERAMNDSEKSARKQISSKEFRELLDKEYTPAEKRALVTVLSKIGHGEAYAWLVSASMLNEVKSTGARAAVTMQVMEEAKHFVVLRELIQAFDVPVPRQAAWDYLLLEGCLRAKGLDRFFGMNVLVETIALSIFGLLSDKPGLEVLRLFHLDESRHTALPDNYFKEFPMTDWQKKNPVSRLTRLSMALPAIPLVLYLEPQLAELGVDVFEFAGSVLRKAIHLAERSGFYMPLPGQQILAMFNAIFNAYCSVTREGHEFRDFMAADTTSGAAEAAVEREIFQADLPAAAE